MQPNGIKRGPKVRPVAERFWPKVDTNGPTPEHGAEYGCCWDWTASLNHHGYGHFGIPGRGMVRAHRIAWEIASGEPVPDGKWVLHICDRRRCTRSDDLGTHEVNGIVYERRGHLFLGTALANTTDMIEKGRDRKNPVRGVDQPMAKLTETDVLEIRRRVAAGEFERIVALDYGLDQTNVSCIVLRKTWTHVGGDEYTRTPVVGSRATNAKLTEDNVMEIKRRYALGGITQATLAKEFEVSQSQITRVISGQRWRHI